MPSPRAPLALIVAAGALSIVLIACSGGSDKNVDTSAVREPQIYTSSVPRETVEQAQRTTTMVDAATRAGNHLPGETASADVKHLRVRYGPFTIGPGQNPNLYDPNVKAPDLPPGFITRFEPNLELEDGTVPPANQVHPHHGVWSVNNEPRWFADAEKSVFAPPAGYGWRVKPDDTWLLNHMLHNLYPGVAKAYLTWDIDYVPEASATGQKIKEITTLWADVRGGKTYPVFDGPFDPQGGGKYVYPTDQPAREARAYPTNFNKISVPADGTLVLAVGHLHPGGLDNTLSLTRDAKTTEIHRGASTYFDPKGPVSWDMAMGVTKPNWRVQVKKGDVLSLTSAYDTKRGAWFESMGLMVVGHAAGDTSGVEPSRKSSIREHGSPTTGSKRTSTRVAPPPTYPTHRNFPTVRSSASGTAAPWRSTTSSTAPATSARRARPATPHHRPGAAAELCQPRCGAEHSPHAHRMQEALHRHGWSRVPTGRHEPGLRLGPARIRGADDHGIRESRVVSTPADLTAGTYTYFCRIHPFMRGAFRVSAKSPDAFTNALLGGAGAPG